MPIRVCDKCKAEFTLKYNYDRHISRKHTCTLDRTVNGKKYINRSIISESQQCKEKIPDSDHMESESELELESELEFESTNPNVTFHKLPTLFKEPSIQLVELTFDQNDTDSEIIDSISEEILDQEFENMIDHVSLASEETDQPERSTPKGLNSSPYTNVQSNSFSEQDNEQQIEEFDTNNPGYRIAYLNEIYNLEHKIYDKYKKQLEEKRVKLDKLKNQILLEYSKFEQLRV